MKKNAAYEVQVGARQDYFMSSCCGQAPGHDQPPGCGQAPGRGQALGHFFNFLFEWPLHLDIPTWSWGKPANCASKTPDESLKLSFW